MKDLNTPVPLYYKIDVIFKGNVKTWCEDKTYDKEIYLRTIGVVINPRKYNGTRRRKLFFKRI